MSVNADVDMPVVMKGDSWFGSVKAAVNIAKGIHAALQVKTALSLY